MANMFHFLSKRPAPVSLSLGRCSFHFALDKLVVGADNIHIDVHISPQVYRTTQRVASLLMIKHSKTEFLFKGDHTGTLQTEKRTLSDVCRNVLLDGITKAKSASEVQIDFLAQISIQKLFLEEIRRQYDIHIVNVSTMIRNYELSTEYDPFESFKLKEKLGEIKYNKTRILLLAGEELFRIIADLNAELLRNVRESYFPVEHIIPEFFLINPMLHADHVADDLFLIEAYALIGQRSEDPDNYENLKSMISTLLAETNICHDAGDDKQPVLEGQRNENLLDIADDPLDPWIMEINNVDSLFNYFKTQEQYKKFRKHHDSQEMISEMKARMRTQEWLFNLIFRLSKKMKMLPLIVAAYEMKPIYENFCPPLRPRQIKEFLVKPVLRKQLVQKMKNRQASYFEPLYQTIRRIRSCSRLQQKHYLLAFLKDFFQYHRDLKTSRLLKNAMEKITLIQDEKLLMLSRENHTLHAFLLPDERIQEEKPVLNHVIIKADIRGSVDITYTMRARGLNPAAYFSLNFFDPISDILHEYHAHKEFIEGDAMILSIFEYEETPQGWCSVACACALAIRILSIVQQYNDKNRKHDLPLLEVGIGICHHQSPPTFLYDGNSRIIISPAINLAGRLSSCSKMLRRRFNADQGVFHIKVFESQEDKEEDRTSDDLYLRFNVNGIELHPDGFAKLGGEINLQRIVYPVDQNEDVTLYVGKVPTGLDGFQQLIIREAEIVEVNAETMTALGKTSRKYYEVCTDPEIYAFVNNHRS